MSDLTPSRLEIILLGVMSITEQDEAESIQKFAELFRIPIDQAVDIFRKVPIPIKKGLSTGEAEAITDKLKAIGIITEVRSLTR